MRRKIKKIIDEAKQFKQKRDDRANSKNMISLKEFAHISNDSAISGSALDGGKISRFCKILFDIQTDLVETDPAAAGVLGELIPSLTSINQSAQPIFSNSRLDHLESQPLVVYENYCKKIANQLNDMIVNKSNKSVCIATGWAGSEYYMGHAMIAEFELDADMNLIMKLHNSGSGIQYHACKATSKGILYATSKIYKIPAKTISPFVLNSLATLLSKPQITSLVPSWAKEEPSKQFYLRVTNAMHLLGATELNPIDLDINFSTGQRSGTCSWKSLIAFMKNQIHDEKKYLLLKYEIKLNVLLKFYAQEKERNRLTKFLTRKQIVFACENLSRLIDKIDELYPGNIPASRKEVGLELISQLTKELAADSNPKISPTKYKFKPNLFKRRANPLLTNLYASGRHDQIKDSLYLFQRKAIDKIQLTRSAILQIKNNLFETNKKIPTVDILTPSPFDTKYPIVSLQGMRQIMESLSLSAFDRLMILEKFINDINLPLDKSIFEGLEIDDKVKAANILADLSSWHFQLCTIQGENHLRFESKLVSSTINLLLCKATSSFLETKNFNPISIKSFIQPLLDTSERLASSTFLFTDPRYYQRLDYIKSEATYLQQTFANEIDHETIISSNLQTMFKPFAENPMLPLDQAKKMYLALEHSNIIQSLLLVGDVDSIKKLSQPITQRKFKNTEHKIISTTRSKYPSNARTFYKKRYAYSSSYLTGIQNEAQTKLSIFGIKSQDYSTHSVNYGIDRIDLTLNGNITPVSKYITNIDNHLALEKYDSEIRYVIDMMYSYINDSNAVSSIYELLANYPDKLQYIGLQDIIFARLFANDNIGKQLARSPGSILQLVTILEHHLSMHINDSELHPSTIFILKLSSILEFYVAKSLVTNSEIVSNILYKLSAINYQAEELEQRFPNNINLHSIKPWLLSKKLAEPACEQDSLIELLITHMVIWNDVLIQNDTINDLFNERSITTSLLHNNLENIKRLLADPDRLKSILTRVLESVFASQIQIAGIEGKYPNYKCILADNSVCALNLVKGKVIANNLSLTNRVPPQIFDCKSYVDYFGRKIKTGTIDYRKSRFTFEDCGNEYSLYFGNNFGALKRKFIINGKPKYYSLAQSEISPLYGKVPKTMIDSNFETWVSPDSTLIIDTKTKKPNYIIDKNGVIQNIDRTQTLMAMPLFPSNNDVFNQITRFESKNFIEVWKNNLSGDNYSIKFPRYDFEFSTTDGGNTFVWSKDPRYKLNLNPNPSLFHGHYNYLSLTAIDQNHKLPDFILTPFKSIMYDFDKKSIELDIQDDIEYRSRTANELKKLNIPANEFASKSRKMIEFMKQSLKKNYHGNIHYIKIDIAENGTNLIPRSFHEACYMAYILHSKDKTEDAFNLLKDAAILYKADNIEINTILLLIWSAPDVAPLSRKQEKISSLIMKYNAEHVALKSFALYLFFSIDNEASTRVQTNMLADDASLNEMVNILAKYYDTLNNIPIEMRLTHHQELIILQKLAYRDISEHHAAQFKNRKQQLESIVANIPQIVKKPQEQVNPEAAMYIDWDTCSSYDCSKIGAVFASIRNKNPRASINFITDPQTNILKFVLLIDKVIKDILDHDQQEIPAIVAQLKVLLNKIGDSYSISRIMNSNEAKIVKDAMAFLLYFANFHKSFKPEVITEIKQLASKLSTAAEITQIFTIIHDNIPRDVTLSIDLGIDFNQPITTNFDEKIDPPKKAMPVHILSRRVNALTNTDPATSSELCHNLGIHFSESPVISEPKIDVNTKHKELLIKELQVDQDIGCQLNTKSIILEREFLHQIPEKIVAIHDTISLQIEDLDAVTAHLEQEILLLANTIPEHKKNQSVIEFGSKRKHSLQLPELVRLFLQNDVNEYARASFLDEEQIADLHHRIYEYLIKKTSLQHLQRIETVISKLERPVTQAEKDSLIIEIGHLLNTERQYKPEEQPNLLTFEYLENKRLRPGQTEYLAALLEQTNENYTNLISKILMGGGKSKVLLPLLAQKKAAGGNLPIVVVSKYMFETNLADLSKTSMQAFGQRIIQLKFSRETTTTDNYFQNLYYNLQAAIQSNSYVLTTPESLQSLDLKYFDILQTSANTSSNALEFTYLEKILLLFRSKGHVIVDEIDQNLNARNELNYAVGAKKSIANAFPYLIRDSLNLYSLLETEFGIVDYINGIKYLKTSDEKQSFMNRIADKLLAMEPPTFLIKLLKKHNINLTGSNLKNIKQYLIDQTTEYPKCLPQADFELKERLAVIRINLSEILLNTLAKHRNENYGLPLSTKDNIRSNIAVPYNGAKSPSSRSEFASIIEQINYTIQSHIGLPISKELFRLILEDFKTKYLVNLAQASEKAQRVMRRFETLTGLQNIDLKNMDLNSKYIDTLYEQTKDRPQLRNYLLKAFILPGLHISEMQERSNPQDLIRMFKSVQGFTGTDYNYRTLTPYMHADIHLSKGKDGQIIDNIRTNSDQDLIKLGTHSNVDELLAAIDKAKVRALIDQGAYCKDLTNIEVATKLQKLYKETKCKYILYFNEKDQLAALPIQENSQPIIIGASDPQSIYLATHAQPDEYFTYYDQKHTTGVDILQTFDANALVTLNKATTLRDFLQGTTRMRRISEKQTLQFVVPPQLAETINSVEDIIKFTSEQQIEKLLREHFLAAKQKISAIVSNDIKIRVQNADLNFEEKRKLSSQLKHIFFHLNDQSLFEQYGLELKTVKTADALNSLATSQIALWQSAIKTLQTVTKQEYNLSAIKQEIDNVVRAAEPVCSPEVLVTQKDMNNLEADQQQEQQIERETDIETSSDKANYDFAKEINITDFSTLTDFAKLRNLPKINSKLKQVVWNFSENIFFSHNYCNTYKNQDLNANAQKPVINIMTVYDPKQKVSAYILLTAKDTELVQNYCQLNKDLLHNRIILSSMHGFVNLDTDPSSKLPEDYVSAMQQIALYNGDADILAENSDWLKNHSTAKLEYMANNVRQKQPNKLIFLESIKNTLLYREKKQKDVARDIDDSTSGSDADRTSEGYNSESGPPTTRRNSRRS